MVDLTKKPFYLNEAQMNWVETTFASMSLDEKIGQMFILLKSVPGVDEERIQNVLNKTHQGGLRWQGGNAETVLQQNAAYQRNSRIPLLIAANCDDGGIGCVPEGTFVATAAECGAGKGTDNAYHVGLVAGREASAIGCNWMFNPVADIYKNWRNTIVNTRAFSSDPDKVLSNARAYIRGIKDANPNMACTAKHFPGDGVEELDQHLALGINNLSVEDWEDSFGKVYRGLIEDGLETIMVGHIALPEMSRQLRPGIKDEEILPATLAPELLTDLLREQIGFNGLIVTDATHMIGMSAVCPRSRALPKAIMAGCDMLLFANDPEEDMGFVKAAIENGDISQERLSDAIHRILGLKAHLMLCDSSAIQSDPDAIKQIGSAEHRAFSDQAARECITLVKDTRHYLPMDPAHMKRVFLVYCGSTPNSKAFRGDPVRKTVIEELERAGYEVDLCPNFFELEAENGVSLQNTLTMMQGMSRKQFSETHDFVLLVINVKGYAQENWVRLRWSHNHSIELPWYISELPTIAVSLNYTNHLVDLPQVHAFINAYSSEQNHIRAAIEKITGNSPFLGQAEDYVFCGRWETRL